MKRVAFWSARGGSGRTMALANVAVILAHRGYRVVVRDLNPSGLLHRYLGGRKYDAPFTTHGVTYADDIYYASFANADYELLNYPAGGRCHVEGHSPDVLVPVLTPGVMRPREVADKVYPVRQNLGVLPFCSRVEDANEHNEGFHWRNAVIEAFCNAGLDSNHFYKCAVPEYPYWSFFHEEEPLAVLHDLNTGAKHPWTAPLDMSYGYARLADAIQGRLT